MGKSSSRKKKRSKSSSQLRMRKKDKVKSKKSKSKKLRRQRDDSVSYSGDSDSLSMVSVSSSSLEDLYRSRKSRSRYRKDVKGGKKRASRRSSSRESSEDSSYIKKRRGSKKDGKRKRTGKRKKPTRDASVSSRSSRSLSCSTCPSDGDEIGYEKRRGRSEKKEKHGRSEKVKRGSKMSKGRSRSSSCSRYNERSDPSIEGVVEERTSRRLKSVITVKQENESSRELITDEPKEEDVYDYDDYPSCRSNDSTDGCSRKELRQQPHIVSETKRPPDDEQVEVSNIGTSNVEETNVSNATGRLNGDDIESILRQRALENLKKFRGGLQKNVNPPITLNDMSVCDIKILPSVNTDSFQIKAPKADDGKVVIATQESQQIRRPPIRRDSSTLPKNDRNTSRTSGDEKYSENVESGVAFPSSRVVPTGIPKMGVNTAINYVSNKPKLIMLQTGLEAPNTRTTGKPVAAAARVIPPGIPGIEVNTVTNSVSNKPKLVMSRTGHEAPYTSTTQEQAAAAQESKAKLVSEGNVDEGILETAGVIKPSKDNAASVSNRPKSVKLRIGQEPPNTCTTQKKESAALESCQAKLVTESSLRTAQTVNPDTRGIPGDSTCEKPSSSEKIISYKQEDDNKDGQFQQKTMSVMRGGEMVQVSYQVYIPKRAPALARRRLKR